MARWNLESISWHKFDRSKVNPDHLILAKTASVVEYNSADYVTYLHNVFNDDPGMAPAIEHWGREEHQHGKVLARWAQLVDPSFDFEKALHRFRSSFQVPIDSENSIRGSQSAELIARCIVECGTMSYYSSLAEASDEPVFKEICEKIARDEVHHYQLFYRQLQRYLKKDPLSFWQKIKVAVARSMETSEEELLYAYAATNLKTEIRREDLPHYLKEYMGRVFQAYNLKHLQEGIRFACKAVGVDNSPRVSNTVAWGVYWLFQSKAHHLTKPTSSSGVTYPVPPFH